MGVVFQVLIVPAIDPGPVPKEVRCFEVGPVLVLELDLVEMFRIIIGNEFRCNQERNIFGGPFTSGIERNGHITGTGHLCVEGFGRDGIDPETSILNVLDYMLILSFFYTAS